MHYYTVDKDVCQRLQSVCEAAPMGCCITDENQLLKEMKVLFVKGNKDTIRKVSCAAAQGDFKEARRLVHTLKSSAMLIGKAQLSNIANEAESFFKAGTNLPQGLFSAFETELQQVLDELSVTEDKR